MIVKRRVSGYHHDDDERAKVSIQLQRTRSNLLSFRLLWDLCLELQKLLKKAFIWVSDGFQNPIAWNGETGKPRRASHRDESQAYLPQQPVLLGANLRGCNLFEFSIVEDCRRVHFRRQRSRCANLKMSRSNPAVRESARRADGRRRQQEAYYPHVDIGNISSALLRLYIKEGLCRRSSLQVDLQVVRPLCYLWWVVWCQ